MTVPVEVPNPISPGVLTTPYVSVAEFRAAPTWLDTMDLIETGTGPQQDNELFNVLLRASEWADQHTGMRLAAHNEFEQMRVRVDRTGLCYIHPSRYPVRLVTGLAFGSNFQTLTPLTDLTQVWVEDQQGIVASLLPLRGTFAGSLEFGIVPATSSDYIFVQVAYVSGWVSTTLSVTATQGSNTISVTNPIGILPPATNLLSTVNGTTLRIYDPLIPSGPTGGEEAVNVSAIYTIGNTAVNLVNPTVNLHTVGTGTGGQVSVSEMPAAIHQAVIDFATALMLRQDTAGDEPFSGEAFGPAAKRSKHGGQSAGLVDHAYELLNPYIRRR